MKNRRALVGCHATAGLEYFARRAGVSQRNDLAAQRIDAFSCVVPLCFTALQLLQVLRSAACFRVVRPTYALLCGEGVGEQGLCFHGLALLPGEGSTKHTCCFEGAWVLGTECTSGLGKCTPQQLFGFAVAVRVAEQQGQIIARCECVGVPVPKHALLYRQRVAQQRLGLGVLVLSLQGRRE